MELHTESSSQSEIDRNAETPDCDGGMWMCTMCVRKKAPSASTTPEYPKSTTEDFTGSGSDPTISSSIKDEGNLIPVQQAPTRREPGPLRSTWNCCCECGKSEAEVNDAKTPETNTNIASTSTGGIQMTQPASGRNMQDDTDTGSDDISLETAV